MPATAIKHTNEALAFITLFKTMPIEVKEEVKALIAEYTENEESVLFTSLSLNSWTEDNEVKENATWENLYNEHKQI